jgi:hypothetical protein
MSDIRKWKALIESASKITENDTEDMAHTDHEVSMAKSQLLSTVKSSTRIAKQLQDKSEEEGLEGWVASKLTMAEDYLQAVADHMDGQEINEGYKVMPPMDPKYVARTGLEGPFTTLSGKVVYYDPKEGKYYDPDTDIYLSYDEFQNYDKDYSGMKDERDEVKEAGGYYTQPVYDMIEKHGYEKVMHELLTSLDADVIQSFLQRANLDEAGGYYTQPVYDMIKEHGIEKVMHELLTSLDADQIQDFISRADLDESGLRPSFAKELRNTELNKGKGAPKSGKTTGPDDYDFLKYKNKKKEVAEASETKYGIVRYPDTAISYIKNDGNGWEHIFDKSYGFKGAVDKEDMKYAKKIAKEKIPSRMFEEKNCGCGKDPCETYGKKRVEEGPFKGVGKMAMKHKLKKQHRKSDLANFDDSGIDTSGKTPDEIGQMKSDFYHSHMDKAARAKKAGDRLSGKKNESIEETTIKYVDDYDTITKIDIEKDGIMYNGSNIKMYDWDGAAKAVLTPEMHSRAKNWDEVHQYLLRFIGKPKSLQAAARNVFAMNDEAVKVNEALMISESKFDEAAGEKDACYRKVKSRYKVWPSAYASGALVKCRKVGASNWGNSKK